MASLIALHACASDEPGAGGSVVDDGGGDDAPLFSEGGAPDAGVEAAAYDGCGDMRGLERDAPWPVRGGCPKRASLARRTGPRTAAIKWTTPLRAGATSPVVSATRLVWVGTEDGDVVAVSTEGVPEASLTTGGAVSASAALSASGVGYVGSSDGTLYGFAWSPGTSDAGTDADADASADASLGGVRTVSALPLGVAGSSPVVAGDGTIYVGASDGTLKAISSDGTRVIWSAVTQDAASSSPAIAENGLVIVASSAKRLAAYRANDGTLAWSFDTTAPLEGSPAVGDGVVYAGATDGTLYAVNVDGTKKWSVTLGGALRGAPAVAPGVVAVGGDRKLYGVDPATGETRFAYETQGAAGAPLIDSEGYVYFGSTDGRLYVLTPTGALFFAVNARGAIRSAPALGSDGTLFVTTQSSLLAVGP